MDIKKWREEFPAISEQGKIHLNNCSASPVPSRGLEARRECEKVWIEEGNPWETWLDKFDEAKARFAEIINADEDEIAALSCATHSLAQVASALNYDDRNEIITSELEFPTVPQFWHAQQKRGAEIKFVESKDGKYIPAEYYKEAMNENSLLVCTAHAFPFTGGLIDVGEIGEKIHEKGGYLFLDAYQSAGIVPIDVKEQEIDMLTAGTNKFLLGGPGMAFLYVDQDLANQLEPSNMGWFGVKDMFGFEIRNPKFAEGTRRFELGTPATTVAYQACAGLEIIQEVGVEKIRERVVKHTRHIIEGVEERGFSVLTPKEDEKRGGVVNVQVKKPEKVEELMLENGFNLGTRAGGVRLAPHFYNTSEDIEKAIEALDKFADPS